MAGFCGCATKMVQISLETQFPIPGMVMYQIIRIMALDGVASSSGAVSAASKSRSQKFTRENLKPETMA
jgi:hypothetical protein